MVSPTRRLSFTVLVSSRKTGSPLSIAAVRSIATRVASHVRMSDVVDLSDGSPQSDAGTMMLVVLPREVGPASSQTKLGIWSWDSIGGTSPAYSPATIAGYDASGA